MTGSTSGTDVDEAIRKEEHQGQDPELANTGEIKREPTLEDAPDGGIKAWCVVAGTSFIFFSVLGFSNSFGVFLEYYLKHQLAHKSPDDIAWIGSLGVFLQLFLGVISGPLFDRFGSIVSRLAFAQALFSALPWVSLQIIRAAIVLYLFALMMISLCETYWQFMLAQGVLLGICQGFLTIPGLAAASQYFDKKRAAALGLAVAGSSIGGVIFPLALSRMLNSSSLGFGWSVRVVGFINMPLLLFSALAVTPRVPPRKSTFFILSAFKDPTYVLLIAGLFLGFFGMFMPLFYMPTYAVSKGMNPTLASYLLAILNAASTFGRVIPGVLADKLGKLNMFAAAATCTGIIAFCFTKVDTNAGLIVYSVIIGFTSGGIVSGAAAAFTLCLQDPRQLGTYMGMAMSLASFAALIGGPVNGAFLKGYGGFWEMSIFTAIMSIAGGLVTLCGKFFRPEGILGKV
ncbi:uncharacterized protein E0L32_006331 [Thyridium curvatum]|uniref:Major facilitator superfamily (MFS) profile domain-containing protein n=1 Tax=Thyridium curvatum TaxID=1093900 RepID=A0A507B9A6_9PEZI|nr:uncharacterized protein E0L32_006331 [Thyridium curvatum]TPX13358.1 hypothetical protein E0L32_006331 [Thyridium curvatum]